MGIRTEKEWIEEYFKKLDAIKKDYDEHPEKYTAIDFKKVYLELMKDSSIYATLHRAYTLSSGSELQMQITTTAIIEYKMSTAFMQNMLKEVWKR